MELLGWDKSRLFLFFRCRLLCSCVGNQALSSLGSCHCCQFCSWCCGQICRSPGKSHMGRLLVITLTMTACHHCTARVFSSTCLLALLVSKHLSAIWFVFFGWGWKRKWFGQEGGRVHGPLSQSPTRNRVQSAWPQTTTKFWEACTGPESQMQLHNCRCLRVWASTRAAQRPLISTWSLVTSWLT